jgi:hypothetical protein
MMPDVLTSGLFKGAKVFFTCVNLHGGGGESVIPYDGLKRTVQEAAETYFKLLSQNFSGRTE